MAGQLAGASSDHQGTRWSGLRSLNRRGSTKTSMAMIVLATGTVTALMPVTMLNVLVRLGRMKVRPAAARPSPTIVNSRRQPGTREHPKFERRAFRGTTASV
jgi:hypothetical protein